jgi:hypothetical protein
MTAKKSILNPAPAQNFLNDWLLKNKLMRWIWLLLFSSVVFAQRTVVGQALSVRGLNEDTPKSQIQSLQSEGRILRLNAPTARIDNILMVLKQGSSLPKTTAHFCWLAYAVLWMPLWLTNGVWA